MSVQLASIDTPIDKGLLITIFVESFGDWSNSAFGTALFALLTRVDHTWQLVTLWLLQKFDFQKGSRFTWERSQDKALAVQKNKKNNKGQEKFSRNGVECCFCAKNASSGSVTSRRMTAARWIRKKRS